ncbi:MAG: GDSL-type esterase/lipase family protein [Acidobacteriota bacterium]
MKKKSIKEFLYLKIPIGCSPILDFSCEKDGASKIWVSYTQYDGNDWEIYAKCLDASMVHQENSIKMSSNEFQDRNPQLLNVNGEMFVIWEKISNGKTSISIKKLNSEQSELDIIPFQEKTILFKAFTSDGTIKILYFPKGRNNKLYIKNLNERYLSKTTSEDSIYDHETEENKSKKSFEFFIDPNEYIAFGDSITYGTFGDGFFPEKGYIPRLQNFLLQNLGSSTVLNRGIPGEDTIHGLSRIDAVLNKDRSGYFLLLEGTNDVTLGYSIDNITFNLKEILKKCLNLGTRPLIASIIPKAFDYEYQNFLVIQLKEKIKKLSDELSIPFVDQFTAFYSYPDEYGGWRSLYSDRSHPNEKGYELMAKTWFESIKKLGPFPPSGLRISSSTKKSTSINLKWNPNYDSDLLGYSLYVGFSSKKYIIKVLLGKTTSYNISLLPGKTYYFSLKAVDTLNNESDFSEEISYKPPFWNYSNNN